MDKDMRQMLKKVGAMGKCVSAIAGETSAYGQAMREMQELGKEMSGFYIAGTRFVDGDTVVSIHSVNIIHTWLVDDGSRFYVIDYGGRIYASDEKLFHSHDEAVAAAIAFQEEKVRKCRELLTCHEEWLGRLRDPLLGGRY